MYNLVGHFFKDDKNCLLDPVKISNLQRNWLLGEGLPYVCVSKISDFPSSQVSNERRLLLLTSTGFYRCT